LQSILSATLATDPLRSTDQSQSQSQKEKEMAEAKYEMRERALMYANNSYEPPEQVIHRAEEYLKFLTERNEVAQGIPAE
jgi:hypothetical protein